MDMVTIATSATELLNSDRADEQKEREKFIHHKQINNVTIKINLWQAAREEIPI